MNYTLRPYQREAVDAVWSSIARGKRRPLVVAPTGSGKSVIIAQLCREWILADPGVQILVAAHVKELVEQNAEKLAALVGENAVGVHSAGLRRRDTYHRILVGGVQSLVNRIDDIAPRQVVIVDEAHRIPRDGNGQYLRLFESLKADYMVGLTATPYRMDSGYLHKGDDAMFDDIAYEIQMVPLVKAGHLAPLSVPKTGVQLDLTGARVERGDFVFDDALGGQLEDDVVLGHALDEWMVRAADRKSTLAFCATVRQAGILLDKARDRGVDAALITGETEARERDAILRRFRAGKLRMLINVMVLTTGFDAPNIDCLLFLRPIASTGLYVQAMGRGMRTCEGKANCLVVDCATNIERHGPVNAVAVNEKKSGADPVIGTGPMCKYCDRCGEANAVAARECEWCDHPFPIRIRSKAETDIEALEMGEPVELDVANVHVWGHRSRAGGDCVRIDYWATTDLDREEPKCYSEYCVVDGKGEAIGRRKLGARFGVTEGDATLAGSWLAACEAALRRSWPKTVTVRRNGKWWDVLSVERDTMADDLGLLPDECPF